MTDSGDSHQSTEWLGEVPVAANGTMTLPKEARAHLKLDLAGPDKVLVFTEVGRVTVTAVPRSLPDALLRLAVEPPPAGEPGAEADEAERGDDPEDDRKPSGR